MMGIYSNHALADGTRREVSHRGFTKLLNGFLLFKHPFSLLLLLLLLLLQLVVHLVDLR